MFEIRGARTMQRILKLSLSVFALCTIGCQGVGTIGRVLVDAPVHIMQRMEHKAELLEQRRLDGEAVHLAKLAELEAERDYLEKTREALIAEQILQKKLQAKQQTARLQLQEAEGQMEIDARTPQFQSRLTSQLKLEYGQSLDVGQLQVNIDKLKELIQKRDEQHKAALHEWEAETQRAKLTDRPPTVPPVCPKCDVCYEKGCCPSCAAPAPVPLRQNLTDADCARPLRSKLMDDQPTPKPILPTEIPLMLPVNLVMDIGPARISEPEVRHIPLRPSEKRRSQLRECDPKPIACPSCAAPCSSSGECPRCKQNADLPTPPAPEYDPGSERNEDEPEEKAPSRVLDVGYSRPIVRQN